MVEKKKGKELTAKPNKLEALKMILRGQIEFLENQKIMPYTLRDQAYAIESQLTVLRKYR